MIVLLAVVVMVVEFVLKHVSEATTSTLGDTSPLFQDVPHTLRHLMAQLDSSPTTAPSACAFSNFAHTGIPASALSTSSSSPWIIDFGATNHMTGASSLFYSYSPCSGQDKIRVGDGILSFVSGKGSVHCFFFTFAFICASCF
ncbi:hypothetical protein CsSME_00001435 [Camellia sinensis var. sinensis]